MLAPTAVGALSSVELQVSLMACLLLDLTIPATPGERSKEAWQERRWALWDHGSGAAARSWGGS